MGGEGGGEEVRGGSMEGVRTSLIYTGLVVIVCDEVIMEELEVLLEDLRVEVHALGCHEPAVDLERRHHRRAQRVGVRHRQSMVLRHGVFVEDEVEVLAGKLELLHLLLELEVVQVLLGIGLVCVVV